MVKEGSDRVYEVGETMSDILDQAHDSAIMTRTIEQATEEQVRALAHVERAMLDISDMAASMARAMGEQITSSGYMLERVGEVREVAETTKKGTDEQATATASISRNFELANEKLAVINGSVSAQQKENESVLEAAEEIRYAGVRNIRKMEEVSGALQALLAEVESLKGEMGAFRV
jgi:methyl-accepting chemotaxis protein